MNKTNKILAGTILVVAVVSAGLYFKMASKYDEYRAQINNAVKDPGSTEFKNENVSSDGVYCTEVNSKNSYGAFVGFQRVMAKTDGNEWGSGGSYVFFERDGLDGNGGYSVLLGADISIAALQAQIRAKERKLFAGSNEVLLSEEEHQKIAVRKVFEQEWSKNCSLKISEAVPVVATQVEVKPHPPMPNNGEPDHHADQGWSCKKGFIQIENLCHRQSKK